VSEIPGDLTAAASGIVLVSPEGQFLHANPAFCELFGYSEQELFSKKVQDALILMTGNGLLRSGIRFWRREVSDRRYEKRYLRKDGQRCGVKSASPDSRRNGKGELHRRACVGRHRTQEGRSCAAGKRATVRTLIEHSFDVISVLSADATTQFTSASTSRVLGYQPHGWWGATHSTCSSEDSRASPSADRLLETPGGVMTEQFRCRHKTDRGDGSKPRAPTASCSRPWAASSSITATSPSRSARKSGWRSACGSAPRNWRSRTWPSEF